MLCKHSSVAERLIAFAVTLSFALTPAIVESADHLSDSSKTVIWQPEITVEAGRVTAQSATTFSNLTREEIHRSNTATDLPMVLSGLPGVHSYSEAGSSLGYSYLRIRGFDQSKIAVMMNGMPLNDPESHLVYFVDLPDIAASAEDIQVQRGAGGGGVGFSPFGGAINLVTLRSTNPGIRADIGFGDWMTRKQSFQFASGLVDNRWSYTGRYSKLSSNGYREKAWSELWSAYLSASRLSNNGVDRFNILLGNERLHLAYYGMSYSDIISHPKSNALAAPIDQTDNFYQPHYQWLSSRKLASNLQYSHTLYVSQGKGSYLQWQPDESLDLYGIGPFSVRDSLITNSDLVREKWVSMRQTGFLPRVEYTLLNAKFTGTIELRSNLAQHWGVVNWVRNAPQNTPPQPEYYRWSGVKEYYGFGIENEWQVTPKLTLLSTLTMRHIEYLVRQNVGLNVSAFPGYSAKADWTFILPRVGAVLDFQTNGVARLNLSQAAREPSQSQLFEAGDGVTPAFHSQHDKSWESPLAKPERLTAIEAGYRKVSGDQYYFDISVYMNYFQNEIVPVGGLNELGEPIMGNANVSLHSGVELEAAYRLPYQLLLKSNLSAARAKFQDHTVYDPYYVADTLQGYRATKLDGNDVPYVPHLMSTSTLEYRGDRLSAWSTTRYVHNISLNQRGNSEQMNPAYATVGIGVNYDFALSQGVKLSLDARVENLLDRRYAASGYYWEDNSTNTITTYNEFYPGAPRNFWFGIAVTL